jgi:O-antigen biosynthesis protein
MRVRVYPADEGGCGFYRMTEPARVLAAQGHDVAIGTTFDIEGVVQSNGLRVPKRVIFDEPTPDVVVLQRVTSAEVCEAIPVMQRQGVTVAVEIDDDLASIPKGHPYLRDTSILGDSVHNRRWMRRAAERADLVTCSTPALGRRYGGTVIRNAIPASWLDLPAPTLDPEAPVFGWTGSTATHVDDLRVTGGAVARTLTRSGGSFRVVGTGVGVPEQLGFREGQTIEASGWQDLELYPHAYGAIQVGIVPLRPNRFNAAKSWLKGLEAAALGVPFVASPSLEYAALHALGVGRLAHTPYEWGTELIALTDPDVWSEASAKGRIVAAQHTIEGRAHQWWDAWTEAANQRSAAA